MKSHPFIKAQIAFLILTIPLLIIEKGTFELWLNKLHTPFFDQFFKYATYLGDGVTAAIFGVILLTFSYYRTIIFTVAILFDTILIQFVGKKLLFSHIVRPKKFFADDVVLNFVEGVKVHGNHSFPSGHTGAAFVWISFLALLLPKKYGIPVFIFALIVGMSRVYLVQHFFMDVYVASIIGTGSVWLSQYCFDNKTHLAENASWQKGLIFGKK